MKYLNFLCLIAATQFLASACSPGEVASPETSRDHSALSSPAVNNPSSSAESEGTSTPPSIFGIWRFSGFSCLGGGTEPAFAAALNRVLQRGSSMVWEIQEDGRGLITGRIEGQTMPWQATQVFTFENNHQLRRLDTSVLDRDVINPQNVRWALSLRLVLQRDVIYTFSVTETTLILNQRERSPLCPVYGPGDEDRPIGYNEASFTFSREL